MAYINQDTKKAIIKIINKEFPKKDGWKFSFGIDNLRVLNCRILSAPVDFRPYIEKKDYADDQEVRVYGYITDKFGETESYKKLLKIQQILDIYNHDNSDIMTDYFDVGYYTRLSIGYKNWRTDKLKAFKFIEIKD